MNGENTNPVCMDPRYNAVAMNKLVFVEVLDGRVIRAPEKQTREEAYYPGLEPYLQFIQDSDDVIVPTAPKPELAKKKFDKIDQVVQRLQAQQEKRKFQPIMSSDEHDDADTSALFQKQPKPPPLQLIPERESVDALFEYSSIPSPKRAIHVDSVHCQTDEVDVELQAVQTSPRMDNSDAACSTEFLISYSDVHVQTEIEDNFCNTSTNTSQQFIPPEELKQVQIRIAQLSEELGAAKVYIHQREGLIAEEIAKRKTLQKVFKELKQNLDDSSQLAKDRDLQLQSLLSESSNLKVCHLISSKLLSKY